MTIEEFAAAVQTEIAAAAGLPGTNVIWDFPNAARPARPFLALMITDDGDQEPLSETDIIDNPNPDPPTGAGFLPYTIPITISAAGTPSPNPILLESTDRPEITVRVTAFTDAPKSGAISPAFALLKKVRRVLGGEAATDALDPITVLDRGNVQNVTVLLETGYEGRAVLDLKFGSIETQQDDANTIETVIVDVTINDVDGSEITDDTVTLPND